MLLWIFFFELQLVFGVFIQFNEQLLQSVRFSLHVNAVTKIWIRTGMARWVGGRKTFSVWMLTMRTAYNIASIGDFKWFFSKRINLFGVVGVNTMTLSLFVVETAGHRTPLDRYLKNALNIVTLCGKL